jgi:2-polyprenyl-3-methyl-5-hydroxy-6-metoxy-1,4-benzoquinol methylase
MNDTRDFRQELYDQYFSTFRKFILDEDYFYKKAGYKAFRKQYLPVIKDFPKNSSILDIGCGTGIILEFLRDEGYQNLYGVDLSEQQINTTKEKGLNAEAIGIFEFIMKNSKKFDIIFTIDLIEHFYKDELIDLFMGINSLLNENGVLIIHTPNGDGIFPQHIIYGDLTHLTIFNSNSLKQILYLTGFNNINFYETRPIAKNLYGLIRLILWKIVRAIFQSIRIIETGGAEKILSQDFITFAFKNNKKVELNNNLSNSSE